MFRRSFLIALTAFAAAAPASADTLDKLIVFPNPVAAGATCTVRMTYTSEAAKTLSYYLYVFDVAGSKVRIQKLTSAAALSVGANTVDTTWNGANDRGQRVAPGLYFVRVVTEGYTDGSSAQSLSATFKLLVK